MNTRLSAGHISPHRRSAEEAASAGYFCKRHSPLRGFWRQKKDPEISWGGGSRELRGQYHARGFFYRRLSSPTGGTKRVARASSRCRHPVSPPFEMTDAKRVLIHRQDRILTCDGRDVLQPADLQSAPSALGYLPTDSSVSPLGRSATCQQDRGSHRHTLTQRTIKTTLQETREKVKPALLSYPHRLHIHEFL